MEPRTKLFVSTGGIQNESFLGSSLGEDAGFRKNIFSIIFNDTYRMTRPVISFKATNIDTKYKHLSSFAAVTLRELSASLIYKIEIVGLYEMHTSA
jgi:hypothetical protein